MADCSAEALCQFLGVELPELQRLVRDGHIPKAKRKQGAEVYDSVSAAQGYIQYLKHRAEARTVSELADLFGLSVRRIQALTQDGTIQTAGVLGGRAHAREYNLKETCTALYQSLSAKATGRESNAKELELKQKKLKAEIALKESQGELHRLRTEIAAGKYIAVEEVKLDYQRFFVVLKKFVMAIPNRVGGMINGYADPVTVRGVEKDLNHEMTAMLQAFVTAAVNGEGGRDG